MTYKVNPNSPESQRAAAFSRLGMVIVEPVSEYKKGLAVRPEEVTAIRWSQEKKETLLWLAGVDTPFGVDLPLEDVLIALRAMDRKKESNDE